METFSDQDLIAFVTGNLEADKFKRVRAASARDQEVQAKLRVMRALLGASLDASRQVFSSTNKDRSIQRIPDRRPPKHRWYHRRKTAMEFPVALFLLFLVSPLLLLFTVTIKLTSRGPLLSKVTRLGRNRRLFTMYKLRTFHSLPDGCGTSSLFFLDNPRYTWIGRLLRRTHLDELPQLWNVLRGDMSLVGPRPDRPEIATELESRSPDYERRFSVNPGIIGLARVYSPPGLELQPEHDAIEHQLEWDMYYVDHMNPCLDAKVLTCAAALCVVYLARALLPELTHSLLLPLMSHTRLYREARLDDSEMNASLRLEARTTCTM